MGRMNQKEKKGFTMIELLAVVVILGIIGTIGVAGVTRLIKSAQERHNLAQAKVFISSAQTYFSDHKSKLPTKTLTTRQVSLKELVDSNYIEKLVDYNKKEYDLEKSYAFVTRMGVGLYAYDGELLTEDGERTKYKPQMNDDSTVTFKMDSQLLSKSNTRYTNKKTNKIEIEINDKDQVAVYRVSMYRQDKRLKELEYKEVGATSITTEIELQTKDYPDGIYQLRVDVYDIYNNKKTFTSGNIVIDTLPPECSLKVSGTKGNGWDDSNPLQIGWYKEKNVMLALSITEKNEDSYSLKTTKDKNYIAYKNDKNNTKVFNKEQSDTNGLTYYAYARDKAGNETKCGEIRLKIDTKKPKCNSSGGNSSWTNQSVTLIGICEEKSGSGCEIGKEKIEKIYTTDINSLKESPGIIYDNAGNSTTCSNDQTVKIDRTAPTCTNTGGSSDWTNKSRTITGNCADMGSGCTGNVTLKIDYDIDTTKASPGKVCDKLGNCVQCPSDRTVRVDQTAPKFTDKWFGRTGSGDQEHNNNKRTLTCTDVKTNNVMSGVDEDSSSTPDSNDMTKHKLILSNGTLTFTTTYNSSGWKKGTYKCCDKAGNCSTLKNSSYNGEKGLCCTCRAKNNGYAVFNADNIAENDENNWECAQKHGYISKGYIPGHTSGNWIWYQENEMYTSCRADDCPGETDLKYKYPGGSKPASER